LDKSNASHEWMFSPCRRLPRGMQLGLLFLWGLPRQDGMTDRII